MNSINRLLIAKIYVDDIKNLSIEMFYKKLYISIKKSLVEQYEHILSDTKSNMIASILSVKFCSECNIGMITGKYNNINFMISISNGFNYEYFNTQDEGYFIKKSRGKLTHREIHNSELLTNKGE